MEAGAVTATLLGIRTHIENKVRWELLLICRFL